MTVADLSQTAANEIWRHTEQRGYYNKLESPASALLSELGLHDVSDLVANYDATVIDYKPLHVPIPVALTEGILWDGLELFRGVGNWSRALNNVGLATHEGIENNGKVIRVRDILDNSVSCELRALALRRVVREWHAGPPCLTFGTLRRPRIRSKLLPYGFDMNDPSPKNTTVWRGELLSFSALWFSRGSS